ncbi:hypothetical protein D3C80_1423340 [compost metagenome]
MVAREDQRPALAQRKWQPTVCIQQGLDVLARLDGTDEQAIAAWLQAMAGQGFAQAIRAAGVELRRAGQWYRVNAFQGPIEVVRQFLPHAVRNGDQGICTLKALPKLLLQVTSDLWRMAMRPSKWRQVVKGRYSRPREWRQVKIGAVIDEVFMPTQGALA